ncbi:(-)-germacrene D synthase-like [Carica papaya]|nr:(-)-germacrene D synthase-like [Carica papaya]
MEEYMETAAISSGYPMLITSTFALMGDIATKEILDWVSANPKIVMASATVCRLMDDTVSHTKEQERGHVTSAVESYMKEHDVTVQETYEEFEKQVVDAWKDINEQLLMPTPPVPMCLLKCILNYTRVIDELYKEEDAFTLNGKVTVKGITDLLLTSI